METTQDLNGGAMCGGVISQSLFDTNPMAYLMAWTMPDDKFAEYVKIEDKKEKTKFFKKHAYSHI